MSMHMPMKTLVPKRKIKIGATIQGGAEGEVAGANATSTKLMVKQDRGFTIHGTETLAEEKQGDGNRTSADYIGASTDTKRLVAPTEVTLTTERSEQAPYSFV